MIIDFPLLCIPDSNTFTLVPNNTIFESPFTRSIQVLSFGPARWEARLSFSHLNYEQAQQLETFILSMQKTSQPSMNMLSTFIKEKRREEFAWGTFDCALFTAGCWPLANWD